MSQETTNGETSSTPAVTANSGDAKKTSGNVSMAKAVERLRQAAEAAAEAKQKTAETPPADKAKAETATTSETSSSTVEEAKTSKPEAESNPAEQAPEKAEKTEGEAEKGEEAEDPVLSPKSSLTPEQREVLQKRIDKEVAKRYKMKGEFDAKLDALQKQVAELTQKAPPPNQQAQAPTAAPSDPLPHIKSASELDKLKNDAKAAIRWAEEQLDYEDTSEREAVTVNGERVQPSNRYLKQIIRNARTTLDESIPAKTEVFQHQAKAAQLTAQSRKFALESFPFLADNKSPEFARAAQLYQSKPWLQSDPEGEMYAALLVEGMKALEARKGASKAETKAEAKGEAEKETKAETKTAPAVKITPKAPSDQAAVSAAGSTQRLSPEAQRKNSLSAEDEKLRAKKGITARDAAAYLAQRELLKTQR